MKCVKVLLLVFNLIFVVSLMMLKIVNGILLVNIVRGPKPTGLN